MMPETKNITYEEVAGIANKLALRGRRVTFDNVRRELGKGNHAQLTIFLEKWNKTQKKHATYSHDKTKQSQSEPRKFRQDSGRKTSPRHCHSNTHWDTNRRKPCVREPRKEYLPPRLKSQKVDSFESTSKRFSVERLQKEHILVAKLFYALILVRGQRVKILEVYQTAHNEAFNIRMNGEEKIRKIKEKNDNKLSELVSKFSRLKILNERQIASIRQKLGRG
jgi:hypothetical protein